MTDVGGLRDQLGLLLAMHSSRDNALPVRFEQFARSRDDGLSLLLWFGSQILESETADPQPNRLRNLIQADIARIDEILTETINLILHHRRFQEIEARWSGLRLLVTHAPRHKNVRVRLLDVTWNELSLDAETALEFDHSQLFRKVYDEEFGSPGGIPFSLLIGDYEISHRSSNRQHHVGDVSTLQSISGVAAAALAPLVVAASPQLFGADAFSEIVRGTNLDALFRERQYHWWNAFRQSPDARYVGLVLPRVLYRAPYRPEQLDACEFPFSESRTADHGSSRLWGSAVFMFALSCVQAFDQSGWFEGIVGRDGPGRIHSLPTVYEEPDEAIPVFPVEVVIDEAFNRDLARLGFIAVRRSKLGSQVDFAAAPSAHQPKTYRDAATMDNELLSCQLNLLLGLTRFAHYVKIFSRNLIGSGISAGAIQTRLHQWLAGYTAVGSNVRPEIRSEYPLTAFKVRVWEKPDSPGSILCELYLRPHSQVHHADISLQFQTELTDQRRTISF